MARQGFGYPTSPPPALTNPDDEAAVIDLPDRKRNGYGLTAAAAPEAGNPYFDPLSPAAQQRYELVLLGPASATVDVGIALGYRVRTQGGEAGSRRALTGDVVTWARIDYFPQAVNNTLADRMTARPEYRAALSRWGSCMAARGYRYTTPDDARTALAADYRAHGDTVALHRREVAVADGECAGAVHLPLTAIRVKRALVASLPVADRATLARLALARTAAIARARAIVATEDPGPRPAG
jgi:hypothetical protein